MDTRHTRLLETDGSSKIIRLQPSHSTRGGGGEVDAEDRRTVSCRWKLLLLLLLLLLLTAIELSLSLQRTKILNELRDVYTMARMCNHVCAVSIRTHTCVNRQLLYGKLRSLIPLSRQMPFAFVACTSVYVITDRSFK